MTIDNKKYNLLLIAKNDQKEGESITSAYERICKLVSESQEKNTEYKFRTEKVIRGPYKAKKPLRLSPKCTQVFLKIIELDRAGIVWNMSKVSEALKITSPTIAPHSKTLQTLGFIKKSKIGKGGWSILRNLDGSEYVRATKVPDGEAQGYGDQPNCASGGQNGRTNTIFKQMEEQERKIDQVMAAE